MWVAEAELLDPVSEVVVRLVHEARHVGVGPGDGEDLAGSHVKVASNFVECESPVNSTGVMSVVWLNSPRGQI